MQNFNEMISQFMNQPIVATPLFIWLLFWKGLSLWKAARKKHLTWFLILLLVNTLGALEIAYIFYLNRWELGSKNLLGFLSQKFKARKKS